MRVNQQPPRNSKSYNYGIVLGMGVGLTLGSTFGLQRLPQIHDYRYFNIFHQYQTEFGNREFSSIIWGITFDKAVEQFLAGYTDITSLLLRINEWVSSLDLRRRSSGSVLNDTGIIRIGLEPINPTDPQHYFMIKNCKYEALKIKVSLGDSPFLERCLLIGGEHGQKLVLIDEIPLSKLLQTEKGCYIYREIMVMEATAYYPGPECTGKSCDGITATGAIAAYGICAVDPKIIPLGTKLYVMGYGLASARDVGGAIKGNRLDLCFNTYQEAVRFGRKRVRVFILD